MRVMDYDRLVIRPSYVEPPELEAPVDKVLWVRAGIDSVSPELVATWCNMRQRQPHLIWSPETGEMVRMIEDDRENHLYPPGSPGARMFAVMVMPTEGPFTDAPAGPRRQILRALEALGVPEVWPLGPPALTARPGRALGVLPPGHYTAEQLGEPMFGSLGPIDINRLRSQK